MLHGHDIVCCAPDPWEGIWHNRQRIMSLLASSNRVLFVEPRSYLRPTVGALRVGDLSWSALFRPTVDQLMPSLWRFRYPLYTPIVGRHPFSALMDRLQMWTLRRAMGRLRFGRPILWLYRPDDRDLIGRLGEKLVVYHVVDEYSAYEEEYEDRVPAGKRSAMRERERSLLRQADLIFVVSSPLLASKKVENANTHLIPNGVDYVAYSQAVGQPAPPDLASLPRPVVGYAGAINEKLDLSLLSSLARSQPQWSLALVGPVTLRYDRHLLEELRLPNVHFLGSKRPEEVPAYVAGFDVCLMPYKCNEWTRHISPLKLYEYLACGKPVVSTEIPAAREFAGLLSVASSPDAFLEQVAAAARETDPALKEARQREAAQHTWHQRVEKMSSLIERSLQGLNKL